MVETKQDVVSRCEAAISALKLGFLGTSPEVAGPLAETSKPFEGLVWHLSPNVGEDAEAASAGQNGSGVSSAVGRGTPALTAVQSLTELEQAVDALKAEVGRLRDEKAWIEAANQDLTHRLTSLREQKQRKAMALSNAEAEIELLRRVIPERAKMALDNDEEVTAPTQPDHVQDAHTEIREAIASLSEEMASMRRDNARLRDEVDAAEAQIVATQKQQRILLEALDGDGHLRKLGELLLSAGIITHQQLQEALHEQAQTPGRFVGTILAEKGHASEYEIAQTIACQFGMPFVDPNQRTLDLSAARMVEKETCVGHQCIPLRSSPQRVFVAMANPQDHEAVESIGHTCKRKVVPVVATPSAVRSAINTVFGPNESP